MDRDDVVAVTQPTRLRPGRFDRTEPRVIVREREQSEARPKASRSSGSDPDLASVRFSDDGTMAMDHGTYSMMMAEPGKKAAKQSGAYLNVWKKIDGQW